jgi:hypothetical protein
MRTLHPLAVSGIFIERMILAHHDRDSYEHTRRHSHRQKYAHRHIDGGAAGVQP